MSDQFNLEELRRIHPKEKGCTVGQLVKILEELKRANAEIAALKVELDLARSYYAGACHYIPSED